MKTPITLASIGETALAESLNDPSPHEWTLIAKRLDGLLCVPTVSLGYGHYQTVLSLTRSALKAWPHELPRDPLPHWTKDQHGELLKLCRSVHETATYNYYLAQIHAAPELKLSTGQPGVRLQRFFAGGAKVGKAENWVRIGQAGQADLVGITTIELGSPLALRSVGIYTEVEIKMPKGSQSPEQRTREQIVRDKGGIYLLVKSVKAAIAELGYQRNRLQSLLT